MTRRNVVRKTAVVWLSLALVAVGAVAAGAILVPAAQATYAAPASLPPRPTPLPRPTPRPTTNVVPPAPAEPSPWRGYGPDGAWIELRVQLASGLLPVQIWAVVQWQDSSGGWHAVEGWQGPPDEVTNGIGKKAWWLSDSVLGQGPFRWAIRQGAGGQRLGASVPFFLPDQAGERLVIEISLAP